MTAVATSSEPDAPAPRSTRRDALETAPVAEASPQPAPASTAVEAQASDARPAAAANGTVAAPATSSVSEPPKAVEPAPAPKADLTTLVASAGLQWVETRGDVPTMAELAPPPREPRGRPRRARKAAESTASEPLTQIETQPPAAD